MKMGTKARRHGGTKWKTRAERAPASVRSSPAFTFIEVLFAIIILGIGMIMIAAMLPVAIKQGQETREQIVGKTIAESGYAMVSSFASSVPASDFADTGVVEPLPGSLLNRLAGSMVLQSDPQFAWTGLYKRDFGSAQMTLFIIALKRATGEGDATFRSDFALNPLNQPRPMLARFYDSNSGNNPLGASLTAPDLVRFTVSGSAAWASNVPAIGSYVVVRQDSDTLSNIGRVFKLGRRVEGAPAGAALFELDPAFDLPPLPGTDGRLYTADDLADTSAEAGDTGDELEVFVVGRGQIDQTNITAAGAQFIGDAQDIGLVKTTITLQ